MNIYNPVDSFQAAARAMEEIDFPQFEVDEFPGFQEQDFPNVDGKPAGDDATTERVVARNLVVILESADDNASFAIEEVSGPVQVFVPSLMEELEALYGPLINTMDGYRDGYDSDVGPQSRNGWIDLDDYHNIIASYNALRTKIQELSAAWSVAQKGVCIACGSAGQPSEGWVVGDKQYCEDINSGHESMVCTACTIEEFCGEHPNFCSNCVSVGEPCEVHRSEEAEDNHLEQ